MYMYTYICIHVYIYICMYIDNTYNDIRNLSSRVKYMLFNSTHFYLYTVQSLIPMLFTFYAA